MTDYKKQITKLFKRIDLLQKANSNANLMIGNNSAELQEIIATQTKCIEDLTYALDWAFKAGDFDNITWDKYDQKMYDFAREVRGK